MIRDMASEELEAALTAIKVLTEAQAKLPEGFWFGGNLTLLHAHGTYGEFLANDFDSFYYLPNEVVQ